MLGRQLSPSSPLELNVQRDPEKAFKMSAAETVSPLVSSTVCLRALLAYYPGDWSPPLYLMTARCLEKPTLASLWF
ncbi:hypothetical protein XM38_051980 [Halomicronema hongdechloris C2206]|uniref:Uncharacterized protein n=1 Tax=Halomicronema hongdechloris C2206 TaxID=1641165 RepID=A0A1Z3HVA8_9CYAN|nr:hypothetical protein XM38_051980 [Halomicronema hongdechloris C2206]